MKTILIAHNYSENSFASMSFNLAHHLAESGNRIIFISHKPFFKDSEIIKKGKGEIILLSWSSEKRPTSVKDFFWFAKIYLRYKPKVVIGHFVGSNISISLSKLLSFGNVKTFTYYHTLTSQILTDGKKSFLKRELLFFRKKLFYKLFCDVIVCPSKLAKEDLESFFSVSNGVVILNPMSDRGVSEKINSEGNIIISYLGRLDASKGVMDLIHSYTIFKEKNENSKIVINIAGTGSQQNEIVEFIKKHDSIKYHGGLLYEEIDEYLRKSHFTIIPSKFDNLPTVGLESLMNKTPLLISNTTGLTEYLTDGKECFKFDSNIDSIVWLFEKIEKNIHRQEQMGKDARSTFLNQFSMDRYCEKFSKMFL